MRTVAALYIDPRGPYPAMAGVESWDETRDARKYSGPSPVVAHPPCAPWSRMRWLCKSRAEYRGHAIRAVEQVRAFGGVLEHPEHSKLWEHAGLASTPYGDGHGGYSIRVEQVAWGHCCVKPTWLYIVGVSWEFVRSGIREGGTPTHCITRGPGQAHTLPVAHKGLRDRTPPAFAEWLVSIAREVRL